MFRIPVGDFRIGEAERKAVNDVLDSGRISESKKVLEFEKKWAEFIGTKHAVAVNSGTSALMLGLSAAKHAGLVGKNDKVITAPLTYTATSNAIVHSGLEPVYADIDPVTFGIQTASVKELLEQSGEEYGAMLPVHLLGYPCDITGLIALCRKHNLAFFEDSAQAHGSLYDGKKTGSFGAFGAFSFYIAHNIQAGELGAVTTNDPELYRLMKKLKANGRACDCEICTRNSGYCKQLASYKGEQDFDPRFTHDMIGYNFKTMEFPAAFALVQMQKAEAIIKRRQEIVRTLNLRLAEFSDRLQLPKHSEEVSYLTYPLVIKQNSGIPRKWFRKELEKKGVETRPIFGCIPTQQPAYSHLKAKYEGKLPNADYVGANGFYIGCHQYLSDEDIDYIAGCFGEILH